MTEQISKSNARLGLMNQPIGNLITSCRSRKFQFDINPSVQSELFRLLTHCFTELERASGVQQRKHEWRQFEELSHHLFHLYLAGVDQKALVAAVQLGQLLATLSEPDQAETRELAAKAKRDDDRSKGLKDLNEAKFQAKALARFIANVLWMHDADEKIRIKEMCNLVKKTAATMRGKNYVEAHFPKGDIALRKWISKVAPEYARKGGRPPKE